MTFQIGRRNWVIFISILALFSMFNFLIGTANQGLASGIATAAATLSGPMTGAICRGMQACCFNFSANLLPYFLPFLVLAIAAQFRWRAQPARDPSAILRSAAWAIGWLGWFSGGILSFAHALS
jgi:hypothetical protein